MVSTLAICLAALVLYGARGNVGYALWVYLNLLDSLRALKTVRSNGRRIGIVTRRNLIRQCVVCWIVLVAVQPVGLLADLFLSWFPFYVSLKTLLVLVCLTWRLKTSAFLLQTFVIPFIRRYEVDIDLVLSLVESTCHIVFHYFVYLPWHVVSLPVRRLWPATSSAANLSVPRQRLELKKPTEPITLDSSSEDENGARPSSRKGKSPYSTPSKPPRTSRKVPKEDDAQRRSSTHHRSPRRSSPHPLYPVLQGPQDVHSKATRPTKRRAPETSDLPLAKAKRPAGRQAKPSQRAAPAPSLDTGGGGRKSASESRKAAKDSEAARQVRATAALNALPRPPVNGPGDKDHAVGKTASTIETGPSRTQPRKKRPRRQDDDYEPPVQDIPAATATRTRGTTASTRPRAIAQPLPKATAPSGSPPRKRTRQAASTATEPTLQSKRRRTARQ